MSTDVKLRLSSCVKDLLLYDWDPIGIQDFDHAKDEYDSYVNDILELIERSAPTSEITNFLWWLETEHMGLKGDRQRTEAFAARLVARCLSIEASRDG